LNFTHCLLLSFFRPDGGGDGKFAVGGAGEDDEPAGIFEACGDGKFLVEIRAGGGRPFLYHFSSVGDQLNGRIQRVMGLIRNVSRQQYQSLTMTPLALSPLAFAQSSPVRAIQDIDVCIEEA